MEPKQFEYEIGGQRFSLKKISPGQGQELFKVIKGLVITSNNPIDIIATLGHRLPAAAACILRTEDGKIPWLEVDTSLGFPVLSTNIQKLSDLTFFLATELDLVKQAEIIRDFFTWNPLESDFQTIAGIGEKVAQQFKNLKPTQSSKSFMSSAKETSQNETGSSGDAQ